MSALIFPKGAGSGTRHGQFCLRWGFDTPFTPSLTLPLSAGPLGAITPLKSLLIRQRPAKAGNGRPSSVSHASRAVIYSQGPSMSLILDSDMYTLRCSRTYIPKNKGYTCLDVKGRAKITGKDIEVNDQGSRPNPLSCPPNDEMSLGLEAPQGRTGVRDREGDSAGQTRLSH